MALYIEYDYKKMTFEFDANMIQAAQADNQATWEIITVKCRHCHWLTKLIVVDAQERFQSCIDFLYSHINHIIWL
mgnify:CR=1 FL=1